MPMSNHNPENHLIISCAVIGAEVSEAVYPHIPRNPEELVESAVAAVAAGASIIHLHVRDDNNLPTQSVERFALVSKKIKERCDCIVQFSTGGAAGTPVDLRCAPLVLRPEMATLSLGTMNFGDGIFENSEQTIKSIAKSIVENGV